MRYANITTYDINNGPGFRVSLFVQGCPIRCDGCFNPQTWDVNGGKPYTQETLDTIINSLNDEHISGLSILGGEPLAWYNICHIGVLCKIVRDKFPNKSIWIWSGYTFNDIIYTSENLKIACESNNIDKKSCNMWLAYKRIFENCNVLVTGPFIKEQKDLSLAWRGSKNQEIHYLK
jgi:anaerobic ribonucleoside-triphosphate reductase activating protein